MRKQLTTYEISVGDLKVGDHMVANTGTKTNRSTIVEVVNATPVADAKGNPCMELELQAVGFKERVKSFVVLRSEEHIMVVE